MIKTDFLIVGSGIAGLLFALKVARTQPKKKVLIITKSAEIESNTRYAQGGIAAVTDKKKDSIFKHIQDTLKAGDGLCDKKIVSLVANEGPERLKELIALGVKFDRNADKTLHLAKEGGHSQHRIIHRGDYTGLELEKNLLREIHATKNIHLLEHVFAIDLITDKTTVDRTGKRRKSSCYGVSALNSENKIVQIFSHITLLATGGVGQVYRHTTNSVIATGDGIAMAHRAGAIMQDMAFIQYHPTALYGTNKVKAFLISEAVRGHGAILRTIKGEAFMHKYDSRKELASRDIVARAIDTEMKRNHDAYVGLDCTQIPEKEFKHHFPTIYTHCKSVNIDPTKDFIPVVPAMHYLCGGIKTNKNGNTSIKNLYACGECACTGLHGANRLASNSLLEALVFSHRAAINATKRKHSRRRKRMNIVTKKYKTRRVDERSVLITLKLLKIIMSAIGVSYTTKDLQEAKDKVTQLTLAFNKLYDNFKLSHKIQELKNILSCATLILHHSLKRRANKGVFYNTDNISVYCCERVTSN